MNKRPVNPAKAARVEALKQLLEGAKSVAIVDYTGLNVPQATRLRRAVKAAGGQFKVEKNTLFRIALQSSNNQFPISNLQLSGLSAFVFSNSDEVSSLKTVAEFAKANAVLTFKAGLLGERVLSADEVKTLAQLPSRPTLYSALAGSLASPFQRLIYGLNWNTIRLIQALKGVN